MASPRSENSNCISEAESESALVWPKLPLNSEIDFKKKSKAHKSYSKEESEDYSYFKLKNRLKLEKIPSELKNENNIAISFWDVSSKNPFLIRESRLTGKETYHFKCSNDGKYVFLVYSQTTKISEEEKEEEEKNEISEKAEN